MIKKLLVFAKKYAVFAILSPITIAIEVTIEVFIPLMMSVIIDCGIYGYPIEDKNPLVLWLLRLFKIADLSGSELVTATGLLMVLMALVSLAAGALAARFAAKAGMGFGAELRRAIFGKIQDFSFANIDHFSTGSLITRMTTDVNMVQNAFMMAIRMFVRAPLMFTMAIIFSVSINRRLSLVFIVVAPIIGAALLGLGIKTFPRFEAMFKKYDKFNTSIQENLIGIRVVKAFVRARHEKEKFAASNDDLKAASIFAERLIILNMPIMTFAIYLCIICVLRIGGGMVVAGDMPVGELMSFITYVQQILMALMMVSMIFVITVMARASMQRITAVLEEKPDIDDSEADENLSVEDGSIEFINVCFRYNSEAKKNVLDNINLKISSGETVGIIGGTGSAKTSLVSLIPRLYDINEGELKIGGRNIKSYTIERLRDAVAMVLQNNVLFSGTIEENLRWGKDDASIEEIRQAASTAQADGFVTSFPDGYATDLGQGGVNVSGGQKQRLCIARALLKKPKIIIFDDSTSAVDTATDAKIREGLKDKAGSATKLIIAQRISSVQHADKIIVLDDGKISCIGTHEELLNSSEIYKEVYRSQLEGRA